MVSSEIILLEKNDNIMAEYCHIHVGNILVVVFYYCVSVVVHLVHDQAEYCHINVGVTYSDQIVIL